MKVVFALARQPHLTREEFQRYWLNEHAPLIAQNADYLGIRKYVQSHTVANSISDQLARERGVQPDQFDGLAEIWLDRSLSPKSWSRSEYEQIVGAVLEDERRFIDFSRSPIFVTAEHEIQVPASASPVAYDRRGE